MPTTVPVPYRLRPDEALCLLANFYARRVAAGPPSASSPAPDLACWYAYERIRDLLFQASTQQSARDSLRVLEGQVPGEYAHVPAQAEAWRATVGKATELIKQVIEANGNAQILLAGETDGFRHLCRRCCQTEANFARVRYFDHAARRPLLKAEVSNNTRSWYGKCQVCQQVLVPSRFVVLVPVGTCKHTRECSCGECNQRQIATCAMLYTCDAQTGALHVPALASIAAPSRQQVHQKALKQCWEQGWYLLWPR